MPFESGQKETLGPVSRKRLRKVSQGERHDYTFPAHQSWTPMKILSGTLGRLERVGADLAE